MKKINSLLLSILMFIVSAVQARQEVEMAYTMRSEGKIYVIVAIILLILAGLIFYLFMLDRKVKRMEDKLK